MEYNKMDYRDDLKIEGFYVVFSTWIYISMMLEKIPTNLIEIMFDIFFCSE